MTEARTGNGVGEQNQSRVQQRVAQAGEERAGSGRMQARRGLQKTALEVWVQAALTTGLGGGQDQAGMKMDYLPIMVPVTLEKGKKEVTKASMAEEDMMYLLTCASRKTLPGSESRLCGDFTSSGCLTFLSVEESGGHEPLSLEMSSDPGI